MGFLRRFRADATTRRIARLTAGMGCLPVDEAQLAPRVCGRCLGIGWRRGEGICALCAGTGTLRRFIPDDPTNVVLVRGPSGVGEEQLVAVVLADGRPAFVHVRRAYGLEACLHVPLRRSHPVVRPLVRAAGQQEQALRRGSPRQ